MTSDKSKLLRQIINRRDEASLPHESTELDTHFALIILRNDPLNELTDNEVSTTVNKIVDYFKNKITDPRQLSEEEVVSMAYEIVNEQSSDKK